MRAGQAMAPQRPEVRRRDVADALEPSAQAREPRLVAPLATDGGPGVAHDVEGTDQELTARHLVGAKYGYWRQGTELRGWARHSLPIAIDFD